MQYPMTKVKHHVRQQLFQAGHLLQKGWMKLGILVVIVVVVLHKDLNISLNLVNSRPPVPQEEATPVPPTPDEEARLVSESGAPQEDAKGGAASSFDEHDMSRSAIVGAEPVKATVPTSQQSAAKKRADAFSNVGFILNPTYAKRHNVPDWIVREKRQKCDAYVKRYAPKAVTEMKAHGVPASITLAQGLLESNAGESSLATRNNNHFGIKCFARNCAPGHCTNYKDDTHKDFFRKYTDAGEGFESHSHFLKKPRYQGLFKLKRTDYKAWAHGLKKAGYATDEKYALKLIQLIEELQLYRYDS